LPKRARRCAFEVYWFGLHMKQSYADDGNYAFWSTTSLDFGDASRSAEGGNFAAWATPPDDEGFRLYGEVPEPAPALQALAGALALLAAVSDPESGSRRLGGRFVAIGELRSAAPTRILIGRLPPA
jgi:hypothetical protein